MLLGTKPMMPTKKIVANFVIFGLKKNDVNDNFKKPCISQLGQRLEHSLS